MMNILEKIKDILKKNNISAFSPGEHKGDCLSPYIVVRQAGTMEVYGTSSEYKIYDMLCYVPERRYDTIERLVYDVKMALKELFPLLIYAGNQTESFHDETNKSFMVSFQYKNARRILNR